MVVLTSDLTCGHDIAAPSLLSAYPIKKPFKQILFCWLDVSLQYVCVCWLSKWLIGKTQRNIQNGIVSGWQPDTGGITQSSVLGTVFLIVFINYLDACTLKKFADAIKLGAVDST